jgi:lipoyl(octanoyl) transferase
MRYLAEHAESDRGDEIWLLSHKPVFTQGQAGKPEHVLKPGKIPVIQTDRGGQVTYHGPGQLVAYLLLNVRRRNLGVRSLVQLIEQAVVATLEEFGISALIRPGAPGVYVNDAKIAALGLRIKNGWSYHGLSLNVNMDLTPFDHINPCGFEELAVTQIVDFVKPTDDMLQRVSRVLSNKLLRQLGYAEHYPNISG